MYSFDLKNVVPSGGLTCLFAKATIDESNLWHRRLGHINFKTMNKLMRGNLIRGLPSKLFENDHTCVACQNGKELSVKEYQSHDIFPCVTDDIVRSSKDEVADDAGKKTNEEPTNEGERNGQEKKGEASNKKVYTVSPSVSATEESFNNADDLLTNPLMPNLEDTADLLNTGIFIGAYDDEDVGAEADLNNLETTMNVSPIPTTRIHKDHPKDQIIGDINSATLTRRMTNISEEHAIVKPKKVTQALKDLSCIEAMQDELLQFHLQKMDVKSAFLYGTIEEEVYVCQPPSFENPQFPNKVMHKDNGIFISQDKYVADILKKFDFLQVKTVSTPIETNKALHKDEEAEDVDVYLYRSMIGSLMYLIASRPDIMFAVCACVRFQVTPKVSHLHAMKRIFRYLKGQPKLGLWYLRDSPFNLEAFLDSDYAGASLDRKSTTGGC
ncbi:uncharacterized mitochondrial protein-like protein [Tanacetum coccineum]